MPASRFFAATHSRKWLGWTAILLGILCIPAEELAGNLLILGSLCNIIVAERAATHDVRLSFGDFARAGIPMTLASMMLAGLWLGMGGWMRW